MLVLYGIIKPYFTKQDFVGGDKWIEKALALIVLREAQSIKHIESQNNGVAFQKATLPYGLRNTVNLRNVL